METYLPPNRQLSVKTMAMPANNHPNGDNFGGWLVAQMHLAGGNIASLKAQGRVEAVAINELLFHQPIFAGDELSCYAEVIRVSRASLTLHVEAWVHRPLQEKDVKVTEGTFIFNAVDDQHEPRLLPKE